MPIQPKIRPKHTGMSNPRPCTKAPRPAKLVTRTRFAIFTSNPILGLSQTGITIEAYKRLYALKTIATHAYASHIKWLREQREQQDLTQADLAAKLGKPQSYVAKVEVLERKLDVLEYVLWTRALMQDPADTIRHLSDAVPDIGKLRRRLT